MAMTVENEDKDPYVMVRARRETRDRLKIVASRRGLAMIDCIESLVDEAFERETRAMYKEVVQA